MDIRELGHKGTESVGQGPVVASVNAVMVFGVK